MREYGHFLYNYVRLVCTLDQFPADLVKFTEEILNGKLQFLCSALTVGALLMKAQRDTILGA